jgi:hypothetical protein
VFLPYAPAAEGGGPGAGGSADDASSPAPVAAT